MDRIKDLILKYLRAEISEQEDVELQTWLARSAENKQLFEEITDPKELADSFRKLDNLHKSEVWDRVRGYANEQRAGAHYTEEFENHEKSGSSWIFGNAKWWAAAAVLICLSVGYFYFNRPLKPSTVIDQRSSVNDIAPGGNKAVLTLGNGAQIILDSARNGALAKQGNVNVIKTDSDKIAYNTSTEKFVAIAFNTLSTPRGGQFQLTLPDGTEVWLDAASSIHYPTAFTGKTRTVGITGQAYFEVKHKASQPFVVMVNGIQITDIGTHFNISAYNDENSMKTTLLEGAVAVTTDTKKLVLNPGEQAEIINHSLDLKKGVDVEAVMAWKNGRFQFDGTGIEEVMRQISRWYNVDIEYTSKIPNQHFMGDISRNVGISKVMDMLMATEAVHFKIEGNKIKVMP
jgi:transmembrane sensor